MTPQQIMDAAQVIVKRERLLGERDQRVPGLYSRVTLTSASGYNLSAEPLVLGDEQEVEVMQTAVRAIMDRRVAKVDDELRKLGVNIDGGAEREAA